MITAGIDMGAKFIKAVILKDDHVLSQSIGSSGREKGRYAQQVFDQALKKAGLLEADVKHIMATGTGREMVHFANDHVTVVVADAKGAAWLFPSARTVIDVGAEEGRGIRIGPGGKVVDFALNEKCAAGAGTFTETMARTLELKLEDMGKLSLASQRSVAMNAQCVVFAESEVVSLLHAKTAKEDIARAIHDAIASRISSLARTVGLENDVVLIGGLARNIGFVDSLKRELEVDLLIPEEPEFVGAIGAALIAKTGIKEIEEEPQ
jgi:predicted CoA-substrate-specific enzyme activase